MTRPPDRLLTTVAAGRTRTSIKSLAPGGNLGQTLRARPIGRAAARVLRAAGIFAIVYNLDDTTTMRPSVLLVFWIGAAVPANAVDYDLRYPANI